MKKLITYFSGSNPDLVSRQSRDDHDSILSRFCLASLICILILTLGVSNAWGASTVTYTVTGKNSVSSSGTAPTSSSASYTQDNSTSQQLVNSYPNAKLTLSGYAGKKITGVVLYMKNSNSKKANVAINVGNTTIGSVSSLSLSTSWARKTITITSTVVPITESVTITIKASGSSVYIQYFEITWEDGPSYTVNFSTGTGNPTLAARSGATFALPSTSDLTPTCSSDGWGLYSWASAAYSESTSAPSATHVGFEGAPYVPTSATTLHAVYKKTADDALTIGTVLWAENFGHFSNNDPPSTAGTGSGTTIYGGASISYTQGTTSTKAQTGTMYAGGDDSPELLLASNNSWTISGIKTGNASDGFETNMTLTFKSNHADYLSISSNTSGVTCTVDPIDNTIWHVVNSLNAATINLTFSNTQSSNMRIDDVSLVTAGISTYDSNPSCGAGCDEPTALTKGSINASSQTVSWTDAANAAGGYLVAYSTVETTPPASSVKSAGESGNYTVDAIASGTKTANIPCNAAGTYNWWVRSKCSADSYSDWVAGTAFTMKQIYLQVNDNWAGDDAKFCAYYWNADPKTGFTKIMTEQPDCEGKIYTCVFPTDYSNMKFVRLNPVQIDPVVNFDNEWNGTGDLSMPADSKNYYQITGGTGNSVTGSWSTYAQKVTVSFDKNTSANGVTNPDDQCVVVTSGRATEPMIGNMSHGRLGYQLSGWKDGGTTWNFSTMGFAADKELTAYWTTGATTTVYLKTSWSGGDWRTANDIFYAHCYIDGTTQFEDILMTKACDDVYTAEAPYGTTHISFARCASGTTLPLGTWESNGNVHNYVAGMAIGSIHYFAITGWGSGKVSTAAEQGSAYAIPTYTISYNKGTTPNAGKSISGSKSNETKNCDEDFTLPSSAVFTVEGYTQTGWTTSDGSAQTHALGGTYDVNAAQAFYPVWAINSHTLTWSWGGGSTTSTTYNLYPSTSGSVNYGTAITKPANGTMSRTGYDFNGWSSNATTMPDNDLTITALWTAKKYSITYKDQGGGDFTGTQTTPPTTHTYGTATTLKIPTKTGYTFGGWFTASDCASGAVGNTSSASLAADGYTADIVLYAKWTANTFTVVFNKNGGTGSAMSNQAFTYDVAQNLRANTYTAPEHKYFIGWNTNSGASVATYTDGQSVSNLSSTNGATVTLYAIWANHTFTNYRTLCSSLFDIVLDDGLVATTNNGSAKVANNGTTLTNIVAPTKSGYDVEGYYTTSGLTVKIATNAGALQNGSGSGITVGGNAWTNSSSQWIRGAGETFYTKWSAHTYNLTYEGLEGATHSNPATYTIETATITLTIPSARTGYTFTGWTCGGAPITTIALGSTGDKTITANWSINKHTVAVSAADHVVITATPAGGSAIAEGSSTANINYGTTVTLNCTPDSHWNLAWDVYKTGESSTKVALTGDGDGATFTLPDYNVTVTAVMTEDTYHTATFKNNGAVIAGYDGVKTYDGERPSAPTLTDITDACDKTDCNKFYGWIAEAGIWDRTINSVAGKTIYRRASDIPVVSGANVVYHAVWAKGTAGPDISSTLIAKWGKFTLVADQAEKATDANGTTLNDVTLTPNISTNQTGGKYGCNSSGVSKAPEIVIAGLDYSSYSKGGLSFYSRTSTNAALAVWVSSDGSNYGASALTTVTTSGAEHLFTINNIPNTTTHIKIVSDKSSGAYYFGTVRAYGINTSPTYDFTELTSENTSGWATNNWDGYYIITFESSTKALLSSGIEGWYGLRDVSASSSKITTADIDLMFKVTYSSSANEGAGGYSVQGMAGGDYIATAKIGEAYQIMTPTAAYLSSIDYNQILMSSGKALRYNTSSTPYRSGEYGPAYGGAPTLYKIMESFTEFRITCCDKTVTIGTPDKTGSGTVTFASGGDAYAAGDEVETCAGATTITATVTPTNGYQCTVLSFTRSDSEDLDPDPAISVPFTGAQSYNLPFEQNADGVTLNTSVTFVALIDHYIDNMHYNTTQNKSGNYGTAPTLSDESKGSECTGLHYKFIGWIPEGDMNMTTGVPTTTANMVAGGATGKYATGTNYYAIWAEEE